MLFNDTYKEIKETSKSIYKEKGSKFISLACPMYNRDNIKAKLEEVRKIENGANHHCYAYILHPDKSEQKTHDDGEPSSTAGRPILGAIKKYDLTNILIVVSRYFGGIKLGIPGLIRAYKTAANDVIQNAIIINKMIQEKYIIVFNHSELNSVMQLIKTHNLKIINSDFQRNCKITFLVPRKKSELIYNTLKKNHRIKITYQ